MTMPFARLIVWLADRYARQRNRRLVGTFRSTLGHFPSIGLPLTYNEKFLWRKIFDHNPLFVTFCDKFACKAYIGERFPDVAVLRPLWVGTSADDIPDDVLSGDVVIKQNNASSRNIFIRGGAFDREDIKRTIGSWQAKPYGRQKGEWPYARADPIIFVEPLLPSRKDNPLIDLSFACSDGEINFVVVSLHNKTSDWTYGLFDADGRRTRIYVFAKSRDEDRLPEDFELPRAFSGAKKIAERLSAGTDHIRCDLMISDEQVYFCEMTAYPGSGLMQHSDQELVGPANAVWDLRKSWFLTVPQRGWRGVYARALKSLLDSTTPAGILRSTDTKQTKGHGISGACRH